MHIIPDTRPVVRAAVRALDAFGATTARQATQLLGYWARYAELTPAEIDAVLSYFRHTGPTPGPRGTLDEGDPTGLTYDREADEPEPGHLVPPYVQAFQPTGRHCPANGTR